MIGYVAVTDPGWYEHQLEEPGPKDANFWRPSARPFSLDTGTPFFFKLKAPHHAIAGFGFFADFTILPDWLAWETFGRANGVDSLQGLRVRLGAIQKGARIKADAAGRIGCCLIAEARFFARDAWIPAPGDWKIRIQSGSRYDLTSGEGLRIWTECRERLADGTIEVQTAREPAARYGRPVFHRPRMGQGIFRVMILDAYGRACSVTQEHSLPVLEAAHIRPYSAGGKHSLDNGLSLRSDLHRLFDRGYVTVDEDYRFVVGKRLRDEFENGRSYYGLHGTRLHLPDDPAARPSRTALEWHRAEAFLG